MLPGAGHDRAGVHRKRAERIGPANGKIHRPGRILQHQPPAVGVAAAGGEEGAVGRLVVAAQGPLAADGHPRRHRKGALHGKRLALEGPLIQPHGLLGRPPALDHLRPGRAAPPRLVFEQAPVPARLATEPSPAGSKV